MVPLHDRLRSAATTVRAVLEHPDFGWSGFPGGLCQGSSKLLAKYLVEICGITPIEGVANGTRYLPCPDREWPIEQSHFWLECGGYIIDITADQFDDCEESVIVSTDRNWHNQFRGQTRLTQATCLDLNYYLSELYKTLLLMLSGQAKQIQDSPSNGQDLLSQLTQKKATK